MAIMTGTNDNLMTGAYENADELLGADYRAARFGLSGLSASTLSASLAGFRSDEVPGFPAVPLRITGALHARAQILFALLAERVVGEGLSEEDRSLIDVILRFAAEAGALSSVAAYNGVLPAGAWDRTTFARREGFEPSRESWRETASRAAAVLAAVLDACPPLAAFAAEHGRTKPVYGGGGPRDDCYAAFDARPILPWGERDAFCAEREGDITVETAEGALNVSAELRAHVWDVYTFLYSDVSEMLYS